MKFEMFDPIALAEGLQAVIGSGEKRKYYRFRPAPYYGGIATADCVGCCLRCLFCWSWHIIVQPDKVGRFYSPEEVVRSSDQRQRTHPSSLSPVKSSPGHSSGDSLYPRDKWNLGRQRSFLRKRSLCFSSSVCPSEFERSLSRRFHATNRGKA